MPLHIVGLILGVQERTNFVLGCAADCSSGSLNLFVCLFLFCCVWVCLCVSVHFVCLVFVFRFVFAQDAPEIATDCFWWLARSNMETMEIWRGCSGTRALRNAHVHCVILQMHCASCLSLCIVSLFGCNINLQRVHLLTQMLLQCTMGLCI